MEQMSGIDSFMLHNERGNTYNHIAALGIYDPASAPGGKVRFRDILEHFGARLSMHSLFRRKVVTVPFGVDRPYWIDGADVDVEFHVRHIALPAPGNWRQLMIQVARLHSRPLDRSRPLWEVYDAGLNHTGFSYNGVLWITAVACRDMMPDPAFYADCMRKSFAELLAAATAGKPAARAPRRSRKAPAAAPKPRARRITAAAARR